MVRLYFAFVLIVMLASVAALATAFHDLLAPTLEERMARAENICVGSYELLSRQRSPGYERLETGLVEARKNAEKLQEPAVAGFCGLAGRP